MVVFRNASGNFSLTKTFFNLFADLMRGCGKFPQMYGLHGNIFRIDREWKITNNIQKEFIFV